MQGRGLEAIGDGYSPNEANLKLYLGKDTKKLLRRVSKWKSVDEITQVFPGDEREELRGLYVLKVNPRFMNRVIKSLQKYPVVEYVERTAIRVPTASV